jgi:acyl-CoA thioesterase
MDKLIEVLLDDNFRKYLGAEVEEIREGYARVRAEVKEEFLNFHGVAHGAFITALADFAFAIAGNSDNIRRMAVSITIDFFSSARVGDVLIGIAERVSGGRRVGFYDLRVMKGENTIARGSAVVYGKGEKITNESDD